MRLAATIVEKIAGVRYRRSQLMTPLYRSAFRRFGRGSVLVSPLMLQGAEAISIGDGTLIRDGAWLAAEGDRAALTIGDDCYFGHRLHLHSIDPVTIGSHCVVADNVMITSTDHGRDDRHSVVARGPVVIGDHVFIGQNCVVLGGVRLGDGVTVGAGSVVTRDVPAGAVVAGVPARVIG